MSTALPFFHVVIVAAGQGVRVGGTVPKQYRPLDGIPVLRRTVTAFRKHPGIGKIIIVIGAEQDALCRAAIGDMPNVRIVPGGARRQDSVHAGLEALSEIAAPEDIVLIHDAARPFLRNNLIDRVIASVVATGAAIPALPVVDTLKSATDTGQIAATIPRAGLYRAQTPQGFRLTTILALHRAAVDGEEATDDAALLERAGLPVALVEGDPQNIKLTTEADFEEAERRMAAVREIRTGMGFDVHRFEPGDGVWLCGIRIPHTQRLKGHSDADVGLHAITDAILGAIASGDIGQHFPADDAQWRDAASHQFLRHAANLMRERGGRIMNIDATLICESPKIGPHRDTMRARISEILDISIDRVAVKATTTEKLGFTGRGEGIACQAIATVSVPGEAE